LENLQVGTCGWLHESWLGDFYPEDMPQEWQLDYYANIFRVVLVPESLWMKWDEGALEECVDAVEGEFGFYLRVEEEVSAAKSNQIQLVQQGLGSLLTGVVVFSEVEVPEPLIYGQPVSLVSKQLKMPGWSYHTGTYNVSGAAIGYCAELEEDGRWQSAMLQKFMQTLPDNISGTPFFIDGDSINMTQVTNLKVVGEFLGY